MLVIKERFTLQKSVKHISSFNHSIQIISNQATHGNFLECPNIRPCSSHVAAMILDLLSQYQIVESDFQANSEIQFVVYCASRIDESRLLEHLPKALPDGKVHQQSTSFFLLMVVTTVYSAFAYECNVRQRYSAKIWCICF